MRGTGNDVLHKLYFTLHYITITNPNFTDILITLPLAKYT